MEKKLDTRRPAVTQPYSRAELEKLEMLLEQTATAKMIAAMFPGRSVGAVKKKLCARRRVAGIAPRGAVAQIHEIEPAMLAPDDPGFEDGWARSNARMMEGGNRAMVAALARLQVAA